MNSGSSIQQVSKYDYTLGYPSSRGRLSLWGTLPNTIGVPATDAHDELAEFSNRIRTRFTPVLRPRDLKTECCRCLKIVLLPSAVD